MAHMAQASSLDVLVLVGEVGMQAGMYSNGTLLLKNMRRAWSSELASLFYMENGLIDIFLSVCGSSAPAPSCWDERRWQTSCAAACCAAGRVARARLLHHSLPALEPQHGPNHSPS